MPYFELDEEQIEILQGFVEEGLEMLDETEPLLIELEKIAGDSGKVDPEVMNTIFRLYHSLKGGSGFLDLTTVSGVTHEAETLLDMFRKGTASLKSEHIDLLNQTSDFLRKLLDKVGIEFTDNGFDGEAETIIHNLQNAIQSFTETSSAEVTASPLEITAAGNNAPAESEKAGDTVAGEEKQEAQADSPLPVEVPQLKITAEMTKQFCNESIELIETSEEMLLNLEKQPDHEEFISQLFRAIHSFKGNAGFFGYEDLEKLSHQAETLLDKIRENRSAADSEVFSLLLEILDFLRDGISKIENNKAPKIAGLGGLLGLLKEASAKIPDSTGRDEKTDATGQQQVSVRTDEPDIPVVAQDAVRVPPEEKPVTNEIAPTKIQERFKPDSSFTKVSQRQSVRVDIEKLDILLDLVGELVISEAMVSQNPDLKRLDISLDSFEKSVLQLEKITRDLQDVATSIRMIPLSGTFRKMIRLVRDLSQKAGKKVDLEIIGEETDVDKTVIEQITDPLVHIIRNSIDHGIDTPDKRRSCNKPTTGKIVLEAKYVGGEVWITVQDDGRGLDRETILKKATERGMVNGDAQNMRDEDIWQFIFQPGFSTVDKITDISGRGVGMDVVKRNIEKIRGKVDIKSKAEEGTTVILRIPLTLAIIDGMIFRVGKARYTVPIVAIKESFKPTPSQITTTMNGEEILNVRGKLLPVIKIYELFNIKADYNDLTDGIILLVENEENLFCLFVDELLGQQQIVIKGLSNYVGSLNYVSGCTILGDGSVSLIINIAGIFDVTEKAAKKPSLTA